MELPEEIRQIVSAYAKPSFVHFREYNQVLVLLGRKTWPQLKEKLCDKNVCVIKDFIDADKYQVLMMHRYADYQRSIGFDPHIIWSWGHAARTFNILHVLTQEQKDHREMLGRFLTWAEDHRETTKRKMMVEVYGEAYVLWCEMKARRAWNKGYEETEDVL